MYGSNPSASLFNFGVQRSVSLSEPHSNDTSEDGTGSGSEDLRRARSLRAPGVYGNGLGVGRMDGTGRRDFSSLSSFGQALGSTAPQAIGTPPRHLLQRDGDASPTFFSEPGMSGPPSPTGSSGSAFSPASAFLSHFSSSSSLRAPSTLAPDAQGARVLDYTLGKVLGRGGFSTVRQAIHISTGETFACKIVKRDDLSDMSGSVEKFEEEIRVWQSLPKHPSFLPLLDMHRTPFATFLIMPLMPGGSLLDVLKKEGGSERTATKWFPGVVTAVSALHLGFNGFEGGILHGDLKLDNFLVDHSGSIMVGDFYMAQTVASAKDHHLPPPRVKHATVPSPAKARPSYPFESKSHYHREEPISPIPTFPSASLPYAPPELLRAPPSGPSFAQDIWALGIILHALLTGRLPFNDAFDPRLQMKILRGTWEIPTHLGKEWIECLCGCLDQNPQTRWDISRVKACDAVIGWREVKHKHRSKSRSRSRMRDDILESRRDQPAPVAINSPRNSRDGKSRDRPRISTERPFIPRGRSRSASGSRSRSSGRDQMFNFSPHLHQVPDTTELSESLEQVAITRGRSTAKKGETSNLRFSRQPSDISIQPIPFQASRSSSATRHPLLDPSYQYNPSSPRRPTSQSPTNSKREGSRSRTQSRQSPAWDDGGGGGDRDRGGGGTGGAGTPRYEYGGELEAVDEEAVLRGRKEGRSRSRGRR